MSDNSTETLSVIMTGYLLPGHDKKAAVNGLVDSFGIPLPTAIGLVEGSARTIKQCQSRAEAERYIAALTGIGIEAKIDTSPPQEEPEVVTPIVATPKQPWYRPYRLVLGAGSLVMLSAIVLWWPAEDRVLPPAPAMPIETPAEMTESVAPSPESAIVRSEDSKVELEIRTASSCETLVLVKQGLSGQLAEVTRMRHGKITSLRPTDLGYEGKFKDANGKESTFMASEINLRAAGELPTIGANICALALDLGGGFTITKWVYEVTSQG
jgi:hypothetical protein